jgi:copper chaperone
LTYPHPLSTIQYLFYDLPEEIMRSLTLHIEGMSCGHCLNAVKRALAELPGVEIESVRIGRADLRYDESTLEPAGIEAAVADAGYRATAAL